jgi:undecaprenyl-diphosphatase
MAFVFGVNYLGVWILNYVLKGIFERERPSLPHLVDADFFSFPSGHAMHSLAFFGLLAYHLWKKRMIHSYILWGLTGGLILLIGVSRVYLGVHYPIDIVAGYMAGLAWLFLSVCLYQFIAQKEQKR